MSVTTAKPAGAGKGADDVLIGGALSKDDLFEILQEQIDALSTKARSPDGISRDDLKPLIKAIQDLRGIGQGSDEAVKKAVDFQMRMTRQLVVQQDIKAAMASRNYEEMKLASQKAKEINLKTRQAKTLEAELLAINRELLRKANEESERLRKLQKGGEPSPKSSPTASSAAATAGSAAGPSPDKQDVGGASSGSGKRFFWRRSEKSGRSSRGANDPPPSTPDDYQLEDGDSGTNGTGESPSPAGAAPEKRKSFVRQISSKMSFKKGPNGSGPSTNDGPAPKKAAAKESGEADDLMLTDRPNLSTVTFADGTNGVEDFQRQAQFDKLVEAMQRVKLVLDSPAELRGPSPILAAAGPEMDLVTGDPNTVHLWLGEWHGVVKTSSSLVALGSKTILVGEIDSKTTNGRYEIRMAKDAISERSFLGASPTPVKPAPSENASNEASAIATSSSKAGEENNSGSGNNAAGGAWEDKYLSEIESLRLKVNELEDELKTAKESVPHAVRAAAPEVQALMMERSESLRIEAKQEEMEREEERRRLQSVTGDGEAIDDESKVATPSASAPFPGSSKAVSSAASSEYNYEDLDVDMFTVKELKKFIADHGGSIEGLREKDELIRKAREIKGEVAKTAPTSSTSKSTSTAVSAEPIPGADDNGPKLKDDERFAKYYKMLKVGLDKDAIKHKMRQDGLDGDVGAMDCDPNMSVAEYERRKKLSSAADEDNGVKLKDDERFAKYFKMLKVGLTKDVVKHKMEQDGLDPDIMDLDPEGPASAVPPNEIAPFIKMIQYGVQRDVVEYKMKSAGLDPSLLDRYLPKDIPRLDIKVGDDPRFKPFFKMLAVGVPKDAVRQKMISKGFDPDIIDMDPNEFSPVDGSNINPNRGAKKKRKRPDDGMQWKKLYWQTVDVPQSGPGVMMTIWQKDFGFELLEHEKKALRDLFAIKVDLQTNATKAEQAPAQDKNLQILESARAQNVSILLSRFRISVTELRRMICTMRISEGSELVPDDVKSILSMLPTSEEAEKLRALTPEKIELLGAAEKHFLGLMDIPRYKNRIACFLFKLSFNELKEDVEFDIEALQKATTELLESRKLARLLSIILSIGNMLNSCGGLLTAEDGFKPAQGFKLSSLMKLKLSKAHTGNRTALNFFVSILHERQRQVLDFVVAETENIRAAASVVMSNVKSQVKSLAMGVKELENEVNHAESVRSDPEASKKITQDDDIFFDAVEAFFQKARRDVHDLSVAISKAEKDFTLLLEYFREEPDTTPEVLFKNLVQFFDEVAAALHENDVARAKAVRLAVAQEGAAVEL